MITLDQLKHILNNDDPQQVEQLAKQAQNLTIQYFGRARSIYAPLYLSNYCDNHCLYCGFNKDHPIQRSKLTREQMHKEMEKLATNGIQSILLLTGESRSHSPVPYIKDAVEIAKNYFASINIEVYPMEKDEYHQLFLAGVDGVTIYQETYNQNRYRQLHLEGKKRDYHYRFNTPERIARSGIRSIAMGILLGLSDIADDVYSLFQHVAWMEKHYPGVEYSVSFPRLIPLSDSPIKYTHVSDLTLVKLICLARVLFPRMGINLSTRERANMRDHAIMFGVTRISAASRTTVGGYCQQDNKDPQFDVMDHRSIPEIKNMLNQKGFDPVFTDWRRINNTPI